MVWRDRAQGVGVLPCRRWCSLSGPRGRGADIKAEVAAAVGPSVELLGQDAADKVMIEARLGKMTTTWRRRISRLGRSPAQCCCMGSARLLGGGGEGQHVSRTASRSPWTGGSCSTWASSRSNPACTAAASPWWNTLEADVGLFAESLDSGGRLVHIGGEQGGHSGDG